MAGREHEPIPVWPVRVPGVVFQMMPPEQVSGRRKTHWRPRMTAACRLNSIHGENSNGVDRETDGPRIRKGEGWRGSSSLRHGSYTDLPDDQVKKAVLHVDHSTKLGHLQIASHVGFFASL